MVLEDGGLIIGCGALHLYGPHLAEIRSITVAPSQQGKGGGGHLVKALLAEARKHRVTCTCLFTRAPEFFARLGFATAQREDLPDKIYKDCHVCPRFHACDEVAMVRGELPKICDSSRTCELAGQTSGLNAPVRPRHEFCKAAHSRYLSLMQLRGCGTALITPFRQDGSIDEPALRNLVAWQVESGIDFLVPCGTTGETPTLSHDEWLRVIDITIEVVAGRVPVMAGATSNSTHDAVEKAKEVAARPGVNAILTASPYYNKPTQEGQYRHFRAIAEAVDKPIILYNVPGRTGANIEPATLARLAEVPNVAGVKEASGNIGQIAEVCAVVPEHFSRLFW